MIIITAISPKDAHLSLAQAKRILSLGGCPGREMLLISPAVAEPFLEPIARLFRQSFDRVVIHKLDPAPEVEEKSWPVAPNHSFCEAVKYLQRENWNTPFYFLEPDCVPLVADWFAKLREEYNRVQRPFLGVLHPTQAKINGRPLPYGKHLVGTAMYPANVWRFSPGTLTVGKSSIAWDVALQAEIVPYAGGTSLIQHNWNSKSYRREGDQIVCEKVNELGLNEPLRKDAVICHGCKDLTLYVILSVQGLTNLPPEVPKQVSGPATKPKKKPVKKCRAKFLAEKAAAAEKDDLMTRELRGKTTLAK